MKYVKLFGSLNDANGFIINNIPFICSINNNGNVFPISCNKENKKIIINGNNIQIDKVENLNLVTIYVDDVETQVDANKTYFELGYEGYNYNGYGIEPIYIEINDKPYNNDYIYSFFEEDYCICKDALISLSDGSLKLIQDITYDDELLVWDFDNAEYGSAKPLWIKKPEIASSYWLCKFTDNTELSLVGSNGKSHRVFNYTDQRFDYPQDCVGKEIYTENGIVILDSCELVNESIEFYNINTAYHINLFANHILTSCRYNNIYPIENMKFVKDNREIIPIDAYNNEIPEKYYYGMRLGEQTISIDDTIKYINDRIAIDITKNN